MQTQPKAFAGVPWQAVACKRNKNGVNYHACVLIDMLIVIVSLSLSPPGAKSEGGEGWGGI